MRALVGLILLSAGLSLAAYSHYPGSAYRHQSLSELTEIVTGAVAFKSEARTNSEPRIDVQTPARNTPGNQLQPPAKSPGPSFDERIAGNSGPLASTRSGWFADNLIRALSSTEPPRQTGSTLQTASIPSSANAAARTPSAPRIQAPGWRTAVVHVNQADAAKPRAVDSLKPKSNSERWKLVKNIQAELKRVGCYWGKVDGIWGRGSKGAMSSFMSSVNASLPVKDPDYLLLALLKGQQGSACAAPCGPGKLRAASGQCVTPQIVARSSKTDSPLWTSTERVTGGELRQQRPSQGYRIVAADAHATTAGATKTTAGTSQALSQGITRREGATRPSPLPGRMAVGAGSLIDETTEAPQRRKLTIAPVPSSTSNRAAERDARPAKPVRAARLATTDELESAETAATAPRTTGTSQRAVRLPPAQVQRREAARKARPAAKRKAYRRRYRGTRSVQSLFTNPLGRM